MDLIQLRLKSPLSSVPVCALQQILQICTLHFISSLCFGFEWD